MELKQAFVHLLESIDELKRLESEKKQADFEMGKFMAEAKAKVDQYEGMCSRLMREDGVTEEIIESDLARFKLTFSTPTKTLDIPDVDAVPDEFIKTERKPMKREIKDAYGDFDVLPNWVQWKEGESKFVYRVLKK